MPQAATGNRGRKDALAPSERVTKPDCDNTSACRGPTAAPKKLAPKINQAVGSATTFANYARLATAHTISEQQGVINAPAMKHDTVPTSLGLEVDPFGE